VGEPAAFGSLASPVKYHNFRRFFTYSVKRKKADGLVRPASAGAIG
jgi:hypothetical protein